LNNNIININYNNNNIDMSCTLSLWVYSLVTLNRILLDYS